MRVRAPSPRAVLILLGLLALAAAAGFMTIGLTGRLDFVLPLRATKLAALLLVGYAVAVSTVLFQTVSGNRILTPSIMGLDALYVLIQTVVVFLFGAAAFGAVDARLVFLVEAASMIGFAAVLYRWLFLGARHGLHLLLLAGVIFGVFFRSLSNLLQRMIDPTEFVVLQDRFFASFNTIDRDLLGLTAVIVLLVSVAGWRMRHVFDVLALGRDAAISLGVPHRATVTRVLLMVTVLVSVSTALVGPVTFLGLLVSNLAYQLVRSHRHVLILPAAVLIAWICLVGGQVALERAFGFDTALSIVIEFAGGIVFILLLLRGGLR
ncbi:iron chelate uptake ABC transporter family permease subunit [Bosea minatitlanensis]|uniref:Iron chelate uptake ABC transporter family permease subunit n=1 Tax=Bosea minatitlanensis TaxID=128782 RepID=A0ABW0FB11_9HYPH|nr:iron chelate uptake ABC transporter family permease subunit [Bosea minatitlanensis]MCT4494909.1 iron chelate uptake ABC transporter family permease subunit [Bosea minatitlanensis]